MNAAPVNAAPAPEPPRRSRQRWLLWAARRCYFVFLRLNGWKPVLLPSPIAGHGLVLKWQKRIDHKRYALTTEDALKTESNLTIAAARVEAKKA